MILTIIQFGQIKYIKKNTLIIEEKRKNENIFLKMIVKEYSILKIKNIF